MALRDRCHLGRRRKCGLPHEGNCWIMEERGKAAAPLFSICPTASLTEIHDEKPFHAVAIPAAGDHTDKAYHQPRVGAFPAGKDLAEALQYDALPSKEASSVRGS